VGQALGRQQEEVVRHVRHAVKVLHPEATHSRLVLQSRALLRHPIFIGSQVVVRVRFFNF
jgi:hypothetical protein